MHERIGGDSGYGPFARGVFGVADGYVDGLRQRGLVPVVIRVKGEPQAAADAFLAPGAVGQVRAVAEAHPVGRGCAAEKQDIIRNVKAEKRNAGIEIIQHEAAGLAANVLGQLEAA